MNTRSLAVRSVLLQATLLVASGCATQAKSGVGPNANQTQQASAQKAELPPVRYAEIRVGAPTIGRTLPPTALGIRNDLFARLSSTPGARLIDVTDPTLVGRVIVPKFFQYAKHDYYPAVAQRLGYQGDVLIGMVIGVDGSTQAVTVLESSGYPSLDSAAVKFFEEGRYASPVMLDGQPVRAFFYQTYRFRLQ